VRLKQGPFAPGALPPFIARMTPSDSPTRGERAAEVGEEGAHGDRVLGQVSVKTPSSEALDHRHCPGLAMLDSVGAGGARVEGEQRTGMRAQHSAAQCVVSGQAVAEAVGSVNTRWRTGTRGRTALTSEAARSAKRLPPRLDQRPCPLQEKGKRRSDFIAARAPGHPRRSRYSSPAARCPESAAPP
jgi:hypothetical protein